jgi:PilZ domain
VLIAAPDLLPALVERASDPSIELLTFTDADALLALDAITERRPPVVALERLFAATARGAALINRIKADPTLTKTEIRVVSHDSDYSRVSPRRPGEGAGGGGAGSAAAAVTAAVPAQPLDQRGTRRAARVRIAGKVEMLIDGNAAQLVDLSIVGAQVVSPTILKPNQRVRIALPDDLGTMRFNAQIAWAAFEIPPKSGPRYRAGIDFVDADARSLDAFCAKHKG